jgi:hypothetical protein
MLISNNNETEDQFILKNNLVRKNILSWKKIIVFYQK